MIPVLQPRNTHVGVIMTDRIFQENEKQDQQAGENDRSAILISWTAAAGGAGEPFEERCIQQRGDDERDEQRKDRNQRAQKGAPEANKNAANQQKRQEEIEQVHDCLLYT